MRCVGENGAGKSTLMKILAGSCSPITAASPGTARRSASEPARLGARRHRHRLPGAGRPFRTVASRPMSSRASITSRLGQLDTRHAPRHAAGLLGRLHVAPCRRTPAWARSRPAHASWSGSLARCAFAAACVVLDEPDLHLERQAVTPSVRHVDGCATQRRHRPLTCRTGWRRSSRSSRASRCSATGVQPALCRSG